MSKKTIRNRDREQVFLDILSILFDMDRMGTPLKDLAEEAQVSVTTLYNWRDLKTFSPRIDTLCKVAEVLGYEINLEIKKKRKLKKVA